MTDRDYIRLRATSDRELLLAEAKEVLRIDEDSKAIDEALRRAVSFEELLEARRVELVDQLTIDTKYHTLTVRTAVRNRRT